METPLQISFRNMDPSEAVEANVREKAEKLERFFDRITSCRVVIEAPHRHHHKGKLYNVLTPAGDPGTGHLNPNYLENVLVVGGLTLTVGLTKTVISSLAGIVIGAVVGAFVGP
ncbi:MAG: HPF/RaiA family ribosome-associated protein, partial [Alphaproteobacteria bacterium]